MKLIRKTLWVLVLGLLVYAYLLPAAVDQKKKEWEENGMGSVFEALDSNQDQQE